MKCFFLPDNNCIRINTRDCELGYVELPYEGCPVRLPDGELITVVNSVADAIPALLNHYEKEKRRSGAYDVWSLTR